MITRLAFLLFLFTAVWQPAGGQPMPSGARKGPFSPPSIFSLRLRMLAGRTPVGTGTGFLYLPDGSDVLYLVSNYHVLTGSEPQEPDKLMEGLSGRPDRIGFVSLSRPDLSLITTWIDLKSTRVLEHPRRADGVDIAAVPVQPQANALVLSQRELGLVEDIDLTIGGELFIVGFPFGIGAGALLPIWKRGTIASEPNYLPNGLEMFFIDATTKPGMSGSPVFATEDREFLKVNQAAAQAFEKWEKGEGDALEAIRLIDVEKTEPVKQRALRLVGVYSGRLTTVSGEDTQVGIVWRRTLLDELFQAANK